MDRVFALVEQMDLALDQLCHGTLSAGRLALILVDNERAYREREREGQEKREVARDVLDGLWSAQQLLEEQAADYEAFTREDFLESGNAIASGIWQLQASAKATYLNARISAYFGTDITQKYRMALGRAAEVGNAYAFQYRVKGDPAIAQAYQARVPAWADTIMRATAVFFDERTQLMNTIVPILASKK